VNRMWGDDKDPRVAADVDRYWDREFKLASGWQPWWKRAWWWLRKVVRRGGS
jgi:hypothetical protein